jgi:hypothetical protein
MTASLLQSDGRDRFTALSTNITVQCTKGPWGNRCLKRRMRIRPGAFRSTGSGPGYDFANEFDFGLDVILGALTRSSPDSDADVAS